MRTAIAKGPSPPLLAVHMALVSTILLSAEASAQQPSALVEPVLVTPGQRVKVTLASRIAPGPLIGTVFLVDSDSLVVQRGTASQRVTRGQVLRIEVSTAREYRPGEAALSRLSRNVAPHRDRRCVLYRRATRCKRCGRQSGPSVGWRRSAGRFPHRGHDPAG